VEHKSTKILRADGSEKITEQARIKVKGVAAPSKVIYSSARGSPDKPTNPQTHKHTGREIMNTHVAIPPTTAYKPKFDS
jgi:hypothetical protein